MKALITGFGGFVGGHLSQELRNYEYQVYGTDIIKADNILTADLLNFQSVRELLKSIKPDCIFHLAGISSVGLSWKEPQFTFEVNVKGSLNLLEAIRMEVPECRVLIVGSSDEYGRVREKDCPIKESLILNPVNPYAISKKTQEEMALLYSKAYKMDIICTRSFNHSGLKQPKGFVIPDFASQIAGIENGDEPIIRVGNLAAKRDFSDVRDVVRAYRLLVEKGRSGQTYNVGSGQAIQISEILDLLIGMSTKNIKVIEDLEKYRPIDLPIIQSNIDKLRKDTGFEPSYKITQTLQDTLDYWRSKEECE
jgi:GDP-D-mannose dehydratase